MKNVLLLSCLLLTTCMVTAQKANLVFFSQSGEKFYLIVNGIQQNPAPLTNVKITDMTAPAIYQVRIKFEKSSLGIIDDKVTIESGMEKTWSISPKTKNGATIYVIKALSQTLLSDEAQAAPLPAEDIIVYHTTTLPNSTEGDHLSVNMGVNENGADIKVDMNGGTTTTSTSSTTTTIRKRTVNGRRRKTAIRIRDEL